MNLKIPINSSVILKRKSVGYSLTLYLTFAWSLVDDSIAHVG